MNKMLKNNLMPVSFIESMSRSSLFEIEYAKKNEDWKRLKQIYDENYLRKDEKRLDNYKIPKKIHQIWLGGKLPNRYLEWSRTWKTFHPEWEYKLWGDKEAKDFEMINRKAYDKIDNLGAKSDIFRLEILYKYGGIYVDTDFECLRPFDQICKMTNFFAGLAYAKKPHLYNGLIGSSVKNWILASCIEDIGKLFNGKLSTEEIMKITGPDKFSEKYLEYIRNDENSSIPFPVTFFYPFPNYERFCKDRKMIKSYIKGESMAIHYWATSWVPKPNVFDKMYGTITRLSTKFIKNLILTGKGKLKFQKFYEKLYQLSLIGMNIGTGGDISSDGELNVIRYIRNQCSSSRNTTIFDVGANVGNYSQKIVKEFKNLNFQLYSFEPSKETFFELRKSLKNIPNIKLYNIGFGDKNTVKTLFYKDSIKVQTIDDFCKRNRIREIDFLKLDTEGHELNILNGAKSMIKNNSIRFIQFEFGGCNIDSRTYFQDFWYFLNDNYNIYRIVKDGLYKIETYKELYELFLTTNFLAELK